MGREVGPENLFLSSSVKTRNHGAQLPRGMLSADRCAKRRRFVARNEGICIDGACRAGGLP